MANDETNDLLKELIAEIKDLKEINEKSGEKKKEDSASPTPDKDFLKYKTFGGISYRSPVNSVKAAINYATSDDKKETTAAGHLKTINSLVSGISSLTDFIAPQIKKDINREFDFTHSTPYKQAENFLKDAAAQGTFYSKGESYNIYKSFAAIGERQKKAIETLEDSPARREGLVAANVKNIFGWDMDDFINKISRELQHWWNNDASKNIQDFDAAHTLTNERIAKKAKKYGGVNKMMQIPYGEDQ